MSLKRLFGNEKIIDSIIELNALSESEFKNLLYMVYELEDNKSKDCNKQKEINITTNNIQCLGYILKQINKIIIKPTKLKKKLQELGFESSRARIIVNFWLQEIRKECQFLIRGKLLDVSWELNVQTNSKISKVEMNPNIQMHFKTSTGSDVSQETLVMEEEELLGFYNTLESILIKFNISNVQI